MDIIFIHRESFIEFALYKIAKKSNKENVIGMKKTLHFIEKCTAFSESISLYYGRGAEGSIEMPDLGLGADGRIEIPLFGRGAEGRIVIPLFFESIPDEEIAIFAAITKNTVIMTERKRFP